MLWRWLPSLSSMQLGWARPASKHGRSHWHDWQWILLRRAGPGFEAPEAAARSLRALPNFHFLARTAIVTLLVFAASTASAPPKFLDRAPDARPDQQSVAAFAASFFAVSARKRKVFLPTSGASRLANAFTNVRRPTPTTVGSASKHEAAASPTCCLWLAASLPKPRSTAPVSSQVEK